PDDAELTCGGTLLKMAEAGYRTGVLDLTRGEMGTRGTPVERQREAAAAARIHQLSYRGNLGVPDTAVTPAREHALALARVIRELQPRTVILPYPEGRHPDHYNGARLGYEGCFLAGFRKLDIPGEPFRPFKILYATAYDRSVRPTFVVDITRQFHRRARAILCYASQFPNVAATFGSPSRSASRNAAAAIIYPELAKGERRTPPVPRRTSAATSRTAVRAASKRTAREKALLLSSRIPRSRMRDLRGDPTQQTSTSAPRHSDKAVANDLPQTKVYIPLDQLESEMALIARWYGQMIGVQYAEPFLVKEVMQVDDIVKLPVRSV
ncbi:MAG: PIG-L family deacetylase, partial [Candidatus Acidiferrales bacterium]